jgi:hypothetical protein
VTLYAGIDPGLSGAVAILDQSKRLVDVFDMPVVDKQVNAVELAYVISTFKFGCAYGIALGVVATLGHRTLHPSPRTWKSEMNLTADKERSRKAAIDRWPKNASWFARKKDDGRAEAALLALWCWENAGELDVAS